MNYSNINQGLTYNKGIDMPAFSMYQNEIKYQGDEYYCGGNSSLALRGMQMDNTPLSKMYFSDENMNRIQKQIKREVFRLSEGNFRLEVDQNEMDLLVVMRAIFMDNALHLPKNIIRQVKDLNKLTVDYIVPDMMTNIKQDYKYLEEISKPIKPIARPLDVNRGGRKQLPSLATALGLF